MASPSPSASSPYLRMEEMAALRHARFEPKRKVSGRQAGRHASPKRGRAAEFSDYRTYTPGDELRDVDWKAYGRTDRLVVRLSEQPSDMPVLVVLDGSASMSFRGVSPAAGAASKYDHAARLAAAVAFLTLRQQDVAGLSVARAGTARAPKWVGGLPRLGELLALLEQNAKGGGGQAQLGKAIEEAVASTSQRGLVVILSDLWEDKPGVLRALDLARHRGHQAIVFHILHAEELALPDFSQMVLEDAETGAKLDANLDELRADYGRKIHDHLASWRQELLGRGADHVVVSCAKPWQDALQGYLRNGGSHLPSMSMTPPEAAAPTPQERQPIAATATAAALDAIRKEGRR